ncbi:MAG: M50 family metallopeptidase [Verrucomicrobiota bacterium]
MVHWLFWLIAILFGVAVTYVPHGWPGVFVWTIVIFVSVLAHEMGHTVTAWLFNKQPGIVIHSFGGFTYFSGKDLPRWQHFLIVASGPLCSIGLIGCFVILLPLIELSPLISWAIIYGVGINFFLTVVNCFPIMPLDGGLMLRDLLGYDNEPALRRVGGGFAVFLLVICLLFNQLVLAVLMGLLAYLNFKGSMNLQGGVIKQ